MCSAQMLTVYQLSGGLVVKPKKDAAKQRLEDQQVSLLYHFYQAC